VKRVLDLYGSDINVQSQPGRGTSFRFELPMHRGRLELRISK